MVDVPDLTDLLVDVPDLFGSVFGSLLFTLLINLSLVCDNETACSYLFL